MGIEPIIKLGNDLYLNQITFEFKDSSIIKDNLDILGLRMLYLIE